MQTSMKEEGRPKRHRAYKTNFDEIDNSDFI